MHIENQFTVDIPIDEAWKVLLDVERIAPCLPGAQLEDVAGDEYRGVVKVKLGALTTQYKGAVRFIEVDETERRVVITARGRDLGGQGDATVTMTAVLADLGEATRVSLEADVSVTGRVAQFGRGLIDQVAGTMLGQFAQRLAADIAGAGPTEARPADPVDLLALAADSLAQQALPTALGVVLVLLVLSRRFRVRLVLAVVAGCVVATMARQSRDGDG